MRATLVLPLAVLLAAILAGCSSSARTTPDGAPTAGGTTAAAHRYRKVMLIVEENHSYRQIVEHTASPYLHDLMANNGVATAMRTGYPARCPSLAGYLLLTSGSDHGICDDQGPARHRLAGDNLFAQVVRSGRQWRSYAESMATTCTTADSADGLFPVRHVPAAYYLTERDRCAQWAVPMGSVKSGILHDDLAAGTLPAFSLVTPNTCDDMRGAPVCAGDLIGAGDAWLADWLPTVLAGKDYRAGQLAVIITWDQGSATDDHVPALVLSPTTPRIADSTPATHCSTLRTVQEVLDLPLLGCAASASSLRPAMRL